MADDLILDIDFNISEAEAKQRKLNGQWEQQKVKIENMKKSLSDTNSAIERMKAEQQATAEEFKKTNAEAIRLSEIVEKINLGKASAQEIIDVGGVSNVTQQYNATLQQLDKINAKYDKSALALQKRESEISKINADLTTEKANLDMIGAKIKKANLGTDKHGQSWKSVKSAIANANKPFDSFNRRVMGLVKRVFIFSVITKALRAIRSSLGELMSADSVLGNKLNALKGNLATIGMTFYQSMKPYIEWLVDKLIYITQLAGAVMAKLLGKDVKQMAEMAENMGNTADNTKKAANEAKKATASFDTLQTATNQTATSDSSNSGGSIDTSYMKNMDLDTSQYDKIIEKLQQILPYVLAIGAGFLVWKIIGGKIGAGLGLIVGGIALIVSGIQDWRKNGESLGAVLKIVFGIMAVGIGSAILGLGGMAIAVAGFISLVLLIGTQWDKIQAMMKKSPVWFQETFGRIFTIMLAPFKGVYDVWKGVIKGILQISKGDLLGGMKTILKSLVNLVIGSLNMIIDAINGTLIPVRGLIWAIGKAAGKNWKMSDIAIPHIPKLATGAVIPGGKPFMAMLGDQRAGQTNIEAPLDTIVEAVRIAIGEPKFTIEATGNMAQFIKMLNLKIKQEQNRSSVF